MKLLQNNFTTPEQSEKLLAMGIPANTADLYYERHSEIKFERLNIRLNKIELADDFFEKHSLYTPHWSVGRLIEIYISCIEHYTGDERLTFGQDTVRLGMIDCIIAAIEVGCDDGDMDFSKLED